MVDERREHLSLGFFFNDCLLLVSGGLVDDLGLLIVRFSYSLRNFSRLQVAQVQLLDHFLGREEKRLLRIGLKLRFASDLMKDMILDQFVLLIFAVLP